MVAAAPAQKNGAHRMRQHFVRNEQLQTLSDWLQVHVCVRHTELNTNKLVKGGDEGGMEGHI